MTVVYDAGVLVAADRNDRATWAYHRAQLSVGTIPLVTAPVLARVSRSPFQVQLRRFLAGCRVVPLGDDDGHVVGSLLGRSGTTDVVDAHVVTVAAHGGAVIVTGDRTDLERLASHLSRPPVVRALPSALR